ncbi:MAG TPA: hypothetical protein VLB84_18295 [Bacteroidia bacterium]|nr:hypothetical protein [Bacteroidia bacterium]
MNKHSKDYFKDAASRSFVEDAIEIYNYLTSNGLMIPTVGSEKSGGRIVDSFALMPKWIRNMIKVNGKSFIECDYAALHPNIAMKLYGGKSEYITHDDIANQLNLDEGVIKIEHLSFFNEEVWAMKQSPLFDFYSTHEPVMLQSIVNEKYKSEFKHKITSRRMFKLEVEIMTDVIEQLNSKGIYVLYVYDALLCHPKDAQEVSTIMDRIILEHGVKTTIKDSSDKKPNPIVEPLKETPLGLDLLELSKSIDPVKDNCITVDVNEIGFNLLLKEYLLEKFSLGEELNFIDAWIDFHDGELVKEKVLRVDDGINSQLKYVTRGFIYS